MEKKWRIYINLGTEAEFKLTENVGFDTKKQAQEWAKAHGFPYKCVVSSEEYKRLTGDFGDPIVIGNGTLTVKRLP